MGFWSLSRWIPPQRRMYSTLFCLCTSAICLCTIGRPAVLQAQPSNLRFEHLSIKDGLSQSAIHTMLQDQQGFMWFGTSDGLDKYDGYTFKAYKHQPFDSTSLSTNNIEYMIQARDGTLWIGTDGGGLNAFDVQTETFKQYRYHTEDPNSLSGNRIWAIHEDQQGFLWIGTDQGGLNRFDPATETFKHYSHIDSTWTDPRYDHIWTTHESRDGYLWVGTNRGLGRFDPQTETFDHSFHDSRHLHSLPQEAVYALHEDHTGNLWVGFVTEGLYRYNVETQETTHFAHAPSDPTSLSDNRIWAIYEDQQLTLWIGTDGGGLNHFDRATESFVHYRHDPANPNSLSDDRIYSIHEDRSGVLWIGTWTGGLSKLSPISKAFAHYRHDPSSSESLSDNRIRAMLEDHEGTIWIGTDNGLNKFDRRTQRFISYHHDRANPRSLSNDRAIALLETQDHTVWVGTNNGGLNRFDRATETFTHYRYDPNDPTSISHDRIWTLFEDRAGTLWVGTYQGGLNKFHPDTETFTHYRHDPNIPTSLSDDRVIHLYEDGEGFLWIATWSGGLNRFDPQTERFTRYQNNPQDSTSLGDNRVIFIYEENPETLWLGTWNSGLNRLDKTTGTFRHYTEADGLPNNTVYAIHPDADGQLWLSTNRGLAVFDPLAETFTVFDESHGLQSNEFNLAAHLKTHDGVFFFGGINGFNVVVPNDVQRNSHVPPVVLTSYKRFNEDVHLGIPISFQERLDLSHQDDVISFNFVALDFWAPEKNEYAYKLEPFNNAWIPLGAKRDITFTDLDPGPYTLRIRGSNNDGVWNEEGVTLPIYVAPPFWETWWFRLFSGLSFALLAIAIHRFRLRQITTRNRTLQTEVDRRLQAEAEQAKLITELASNNTQLEQKNAELERFAYTVSHDLKSPLVTINGFLGLLQHDIAAGDAHRVKQDVEHINGAIETMGHLLEDLLQLSKVGLRLNPPTLLKPSQIAQQVADRMAPQLASQNALLELEPDMPAVYGDAVRLLEVYQNLLENALKFERAGNTPHIQIGVRRDNTPPVFYVRDNGIGVPPQYHHKIFDLFERLHAETDGTGIGLAVVKRIIESHKGHIWVESEGHNRGSAFCFTLPLEQSN